MSGKIIITAPTNGISPFAKLWVLIDETHNTTLKKGETITIEIENDCAVSAQMEYLAMTYKPCKDVLVSASHSTKINIKYNTFTGKIELVVTERKNANGEIVDEYPEDKEKPFLVFDGGVKDILNLYEDYITITHKGALNALAMGIKGDKRIYYSDITSVQYRQPKIVAGYIQFSLPGGNENKGGVFGAMGDENSIAVSQGDPAFARKAQEVVDIINNKIRETKSHKNAATVVTQQLSAADELKKFKELLDMGIITEEEFNEKKKQLLGL